MSAEQSVWDLLDELMVQAAEDQAALAALRGELRAGRQGQQKRPLLTLIRGGGDEPAGRVSRRSTEQS